MSEGLVRARRDDLLEKLVKALQAAAVSPSVLTLEAASLEAIEAPAHRGLSPLATNAVVLRYIEAESRPAVDADRAQDARQRTFVRHALPRARGRRCARQGAGQRRSFDSDGLAQGLDSVQATAMSVHAREQLRHLSENQYACWRVSRA